MTALELQATIAHMGAAARAASAKMAAAPSASKNLALTALARLLRHETAAPMWAMVACSSRAVIQALSQSR